MLLHVVIYGVFAVALGPFESLSAAVLVVLLIAISVNDILHFEIPDVLSLVLFLSGLAFLRDASSEILTSHILAGLGFAGLLFLVGHFYANLRGQIGLGFGDVKLAAGLGIWLGLDASVSTLLFASVSGTITLLMITLILRKPIEHMGQSGVAFGPFLCLSAWGIWLQGSIL